MENLCWQRVQLSHTYSCHASGDAGGLEVKVKAQAGDKTWESLAELGWIRSLRGEKTARASPTRGAQEEQLRRVRNHSDGGRREAGKYVVMEIKGHECFKKETVTPNDLEAWE